MRILLPFLVYLVATTSAAADKPAWVCITRPMFAKAVQPLAHKRRSEGFDVRVIATNRPKAELRALPASTDYLLIVGDDQTDKADQPWYVPARRMQTYRWDRRQADYFASDLAWSDGDGDRQPDFPVGRIPARTAQLATRVVMKILAYERLSPSVAELNLPVMAGDPSFGETIDRLATGLLVASVRNHGPGWAQPWIVVGDPTSVLSGWPPDQPAAYTRRLAQGPALACMIGHGTERGFYFLHWGADRLYFTAADAQAVLNRGRPSGPLVILACLTAGFTGDEPCLAESLLAMPAGPVATIGATEPSHPLPNYFSGVSLLRMADDEHARLGDFWMATQREMLRSRDYVMEKLLLGGSDSLDQHKLRRHQFLLYAILGDPATRLKLPAKLHGKVTRGPGLLSWQVDKPDGAKKLYVHFRPAGQVLPTLDERASAATRRRLHRQANKIFEFRQVAVLNADEPWQGRWTRPGTLRLVAIGPKTLHAVALVLKAPAPAAAAR